MSLALPTPSEYARMSWSARQAATSRLRQLQRGATSDAIEQARLILADIPAEPPLACARRRRVLEDAVAGWTQGRPLKRIQKTNDRETA